MTHPSTTASPRAAASSLNVPSPEPADVDVQEAVVVDVDKGRPLLPHLRGVALVPHAGLVRHVLELPVAQVAEQAAALRLADDEDVGPAVAVIVADGDTRADRADLELAVARAPDAGIVVLVLRDDAGVLR
jgi:hypothetical protein